MVHRWLVTAFTLTVVLGIWGVPPASGDHPTSAVAPTLITPDDVDKECQDVLDPGDFDVLVRIGSPLESDTFPFGNGALSGEITLDVNDPLFAFSIDGAVAVSVLVKGGGDANWYDYRVLGGVSSDVDLHAPINPQTDEPFDVSHAYVCLAEAPPDDEVPPQDEDEVDDTVPAPARAVAVEPVFTG